ncbi:MAG: hypothetical protein MUO53_07355 [Maribacter sp.]|nr:hypothetical protein [Maribacter sp.]
MKRFRILYFFLLVGSFLFAQEKPEREHRIKKSQFPKIELAFESAGQVLKQIRYYREVDSAGTIYSLKFKSGRLHYHFDFDSAGIFTNSGFRVKQIDIPMETYEQLEGYLSRNFEKIKILRIFQEYPLRNGTNQTQETIINSTFQNLLQSNNEYKVMIHGSRKGVQNDFELWFDAEGNFMRMRSALPRNLDRVLY